MTGLRRALPSAVLTLAAALIIAGCGGGEARGGGAAGAWLPGREWRVEKSAVIGGGGGPEFGRIVDLALDAQGRVWVADGGHNQIQVFGPGGEPVRTVGRRGGGPGEFLGLAGMDWDADGRLWTVDGVSARYTVWDTAGAVLSTRPRSISISASPWVLGFDRRGRLYDVSASTAVSGVDGIVRYDSLLQPLDTFRIPPFHQPAVERTTRNGRAVSVSRTIMPFAPEQQWVLDPGGYVWVAVTDRYRIERRGFDGRPDRVLSRDIPPVAVSPAQRKAALDQLRDLRRQGARVDPSRLPSTLPLLFDFLVSDDGHVWVRTTARDGFAYDVFAPSGTYLGEVRVPLRLSPSPAPAFRGDAMAAVVVDGDGVESVVLLRIIRSAP